MSDAIFLVENNGFNRANYPEEIGRAYNNPPANVCVKRVVPYREHECQCGHTWRGKVEFDPNTQNISAEKTNWCPECQQKPFSSSAWVHLDGKPFEFPEPLKPGEVDPKQMKLAEFKPKKRFGNTSANMVLAGTLINSLASFWQFYVNKPDVDKHLIQEKILKDLPDSICEVFEDMFGEGDLPELDENLITHEVQKAIGECAHIIQYLLEKAETIYQAKETSNEPLFKQSCIEVYTFWKVWRLHIHDRRLNFEFNDLAFVVDRGLKEGFREEV